MSLHSLHIVVDVAVQDAEDTMRAIAIAACFRDICPPALGVRISFLSCSSRFEHLIKDAGFVVVPAQPRVEGIGIMHVLGWNFPEFFSSVEIAKTFIEGQLAAFKELEPDVVFHGLWAPASFAARILGIETINFLPIPLHPPSFAHGLVRYLPNMLPVLTRLHRSARRRLACWGSGLMANASIFKQHRLGAAARACGWPIEGPISLFDMNTADLNLVNDHPVFHMDYLYRIPKSIVITGPLYTDNGAELDADIAAHLKRPGPSILVKMDSSGTEEFLFETIKAFRMNRADGWNAVVLASPSICPVEEARGVAGNNSRLLITDRLVPGLKASTLADLCVVHGGQITVQTATAAGKPIVGVALQIEQQTNLDNVMSVKAGIRIQKQFWRTKTIRGVV